MWIKAYHDPELLKLPTNYEILKQVYFWRNKYLKFKKEDLSHKKHIHCTKNEVFY